MPLSVGTQSLLWPDPIPPDTAERAVEAAFWRGSVASRLRTRSEQKVLGQFMTPPAIARFMAQGMLAGRDWSGLTVRLLDPAAGSGVLSAALVEAALALPGRPARIELLMFEIDPQMQPLLAATAAQLEVQCGRLGVAFDWQAKDGDFLLSEIALRGEAAVDAVIANPPYFKLPGSDPRAVLHASSVHGQPNIYGLFMGICAALVRANGSYCFITPRSWTNGAYFRALRARLFERLTIDALHLFDSRVSHFRDDAVLQEALICWASAGRGRGPVRISTSAGASDLDAAVLKIWPSSDVIGAGPDLTVAVPTAAAREQSMDFPARLCDLGLKVSTGAVVGFRAAAHLRPQSGPTTAPLLWMRHVQRMQVEWPGRHRSEHMEINEQSAWMLMPNRPVVLTRRFSPKEDRCRVTAAPYTGNLAGQWIGFENHLNVIHSPDNLLGVDAARGLAIYLNSARVDAYLRRVLGSTQINAVELRALPVPSLLTLESIGRASVDCASLEDAMGIGFRRSEPVARHA